MSAVQQSPPSVRLTTDELESMVAEIPEEHWSEVRPAWPAIRPRR